MVIFAIPSLTQAQSLDTSLVSVTNADAARDFQIIEADVGEGTTLDSIKLYYRFRGGEYSTIPMWPTNQPGIYAAEVQTRGANSTLMEYYIEAEDTSGEQLLKGTKSVPLSRTLEPRSGKQADTSSQEPALETTADTAPVSETSTKRKYLYYALGLLAVGAVVATVGSGDDDSSDDGNCEAGRCDLPVVFPE